MPLLSSGSIFFWRCSPCSSAQMGSGALRFVSVVRCTCTHKIYSHSFIHMKKREVSCSTSESEAVQWERLRVTLHCLVWSIGFLFENAVAQKHSRVDLLSFIVLLHLQQNPIYSQQRVENRIGLRSAPSVLTHSLASCLRDKVQIFLRSSIRRTEIDVFTPVVPAGMLSWKNKIQFPILESITAAPDFSSSILFMQL